MDTNTIALVQTVAIFLALFGFWWKLDAKIEKVREASEDAHKEINDKLNAIEITQATHSERFNTIGERFNTIDERFNTVQRQIQSVDDKVDRLREGK